MWDKSQPYYRSLQNSQGDSQPALKHTPWKFSTFSTFSTFSLFSILPLVYLTIDSEYNLMNFVLFAPFPVQFIQLLVTFRYHMNWLCSVSLIFSVLICTVFNLILFLTEWYEDLNAHTVEKDTSQVHGTGTIWKRCIPASCKAWVH